MGAEAPSADALARRRLGGVDGDLVDRALRALLKHHESSAANGNDQLLGSDADVQVQFSLARIPGSAGPKPMRIEIPHPLVRLSSSDGDDDGLQDVEACLILKDSSKPWVQELISRFPAELRCVKKVLGLQSIRTKHKTFEQRRALLGRFDVFFADDRILPMLTKGLGGKFFDKKKQPIPVKITREEALPFAIQRCLSSTFMYLNAGTCITVRAGNTDMPPSKLLANVLAVCSAVPTKVPRKWSNICSISIKTPSSMSLPVYNRTPEELELISRLARGEEKEEVLEEEGGVVGDKMKRKMAVNTPLARALKKQKALEAEGLSGKEGASAKSEKLAKKKKERKGSFEAAERGEDKEKGGVVNSPLSKPNEEDATESVVQPGKEDGRGEKGWEVSAESGRKPSKKKRKGSIERVEDGEESLKAVGASARACTDKAAGGDHGGRARAGLVPPTETALERSVVVSAKKSTIKRRKESIEEERGEDGNNAIGAPRPAKTPTKQNGAEEGGGGSKGFPVKLGKKPTRKKRKEPIDKLNEEAGYISVAGASAKNSAEDKEDLVIEVQGVVAARKDSSTAPLAKPPKKEEKDAKGKGEEVLSKSESKSSRRRRRRKESMDKAAEEAGEKERVEAAEASAKKSAGEERDELVAKAGEEDEKKESAGTAPPTTTPMKQREAEEDGAGEGKGKEVSAKSAKKSARKMKSKESINQVEQEAGNVSVNGALVKNLAEEKREEAFGEAPGGEEMKKDVSTAQPTKTPKKGDGKRKDEEVSSKSKSRSARRRRKRKESMDRAAEEAGEKERAEAPDASVKKSVGEERDEPVVEAREEDQKKASASTAPLAETPMKQKDAEEDGAGEGKDEENSAKTAKKSARKKRKEFIDQADEEVRKVSIAGAPATNPAEEKREEAVGETPGGEEVKKDASTAPPANTPEKGDNEGKGEEVLPKSESKSARKRRKRKKSINRVVEGGDKEGADDAEASIKKPAGEERNERVVEVGYEDDKKASVNNLPPTKTPTKQNDAGEEGGGKGRDGEVSEKLGKKSARKKKKNGSVDQAEEGGSKEVTAEVAAGITAATVEEMAEEKTKSGKSARKKRKGSIDQAEEDAGKHSVVVAEAYSKKPAGKEIDGTVDETIKENDGKTTASPKKTTNEYGGGVGKGNGVPVKSGKKSARKKKRKGSDQTQDGAGKDGTEVEESVEKESQENKEKTAFSSIPPEKTPRNEKAAKEEKEVGGQVKEVSVKSELKSARKRGRSRKSIGMSVQQGNNESTNAACESVKKLSEKKDGEANDEAERISKEDSDQVTQHEIMTIKRKRKPTTDEADEMVAAKAKTPISPKRRFNDEAELAKEIKTPKSASKMRNESTDNNVKSSIKKRKGAIYDKRVEGQTVNKPNMTKTTKKYGERTDDNTTHTTSTTTASSKKAPKNKSDEYTEFISSEKFSGIRKGYVFRKDDSGVGYYKDVPPVVDRAWLSGLGKSSCGGGGRKSMGHGSKRKKGGRSRRSF